MAEDAGIEKTKSKRRAREIAIFLRLQMKISDVEFQGDGSKGYFLLYGGRTSRFSGN